MVEPGKLGVTGDRVHLTAITLHGRSEEHFPAASSEVGVVAEV